MDTIAASLMLLAGALHATWHVMVKGASAPSLLVGMGLVSALLACPFLFLVPCPLPSLWPIYVLSISLHVGYKLFLGLAYERGELSKAYPLMRALVPICATIVSFIESGLLPSTAQLVGIVLVSAGAFGLAIGGIRSDLGARLSLLALAASAMVAGYSIVDAHGARSPFGWLSFTTWLIFLDGVVFALVARIIQGAALWSQLNNLRGRTVVASALGTASFAVYVWALSLSPLAVVATFRECGIVFAAFLGVFVLKERLRLTRLVAIGAIVAGVAMIAV
ncbi:DMT family transporter [Bradyrhizobium liaoningense]|uniref:DMT family transporter n=1 Tax=Bradyrhizobium liaoningense TaxID=43992 RepID=UPI001BA5F01B|nr:DMT family transporter [Bradyrhizobium liaoningense]MBR0856673.1 EamA family transporter [Bradyrhizobium liaoningense]